MWHGKKQENMAHVQEKKKKPKTVPEEAQKLELFDKGFKSAFPNMFKKLENIS